MVLQMWVLCLALLGLGSALVCPDGGMCEDRNTCCKNTMGGYGCCPLPHAECCSDHLHCCFEGTLCDLVHKTCVNKTASLPWVTRLPTKQAWFVPQLDDTVKAVICPDQESECPDDTTCCELPDGSWGCCPLTKAVCCEDKRHCCPEGTQCDLVHSKCVSASLKSFPLLEKLPARKRRDNAGLREAPAPTSGSVQCPDGKTKCPSGTSCCPTGKGDYNCCFYPNAVCCSDNIHCCPSNTTCDLELQICRTSHIHVPLMKKTPALTNDVKCPDPTTTCPDETTCCKMSNSSYGCCPMPNAVCCSDLIHCCPEGTQCDLIHSTCSSARGDVTMASKIPAAAAAAVTKVTAAQSKVGAVPCNDSVACAEGNTCCKSPTGQWACCPLAEAVCCEDHLHCCPHGTVCDLAASTCNDPSGSAVMPWLSKQPVLPLATDNTKCDRSMSCPGKSTCCKMASGGWACCPLTQAVCCDDHVHCCPHGTVCNLEAQTCDNPSGASLSLPWVEKVTALTSEDEDEKCDKETMCPGGTTCCKKNSGQWACCPLPQAVCCSDHEHCCPKGYKCNVAEQTCDKPEHLSVPWLQKVPALQTDSSSVSFSGPVRSDRNMCDSQTSCPKDTTCCFMDRTQKWGCCPLPKAVCCKDGNHCCPSGHTCEPHRSSCSRGSHVIPWFTKVSARTEPAAVTDVKCDDKSSCASGTTCCKLPTGEWGCCPLVKAVCCADHEHCCPQGYTCNMQTGTCEKKAHDPLVHTLPQIAVVRSEPRGEAVPCDGAGEFRCSREETCCRTSSTAWACCPSPQATCCADTQHCCPLGYSCDLQSGGCSLKTPLTWDSLLGDRKKHSAPGGL